MNRAGSFVSCCGAESVQELSKADAARAASDGYAALRMLSVGKISMDGVKVQCCAFFAA